MAVTEMKGRDSGSRHSHGHDRNSYRGRRRNRDSSHRSSGGIVRYLLLLLFLLAVVQGKSISGSLLEAPKTAAATTAGVSTAFNQQLSRYLSSNRDLSDTSNSNGYDDTRRMGCMQDINKKLTQFPDSVAIDYMTSMTMMDLVKQRHYMAIQTMYSNKDGVVDHYRNACEDVAGGIFVSSDFLVLECNKTHHSYADDDDDNDNDVKEPPYNVTTTDIHINNGACFTKGDACQHYVDHPDDWLLDTKQLFGNICEIRDDFQTIDDAYESLISHPDNVPYIDVPAFVDATPPNYNKDRQKKCMSAFKRWIFDDKYEKVTDEALYHASRTHIDLLQISVDPPPTRVVQREYYGMDDDKDDADHLQAYQDLCKEANGRFDSFTSILDCLGVGGTNWNRRQTILTQNAATCFPTGPTSGCDDYTMEQWRIDTLMSTINLSCTARSKDKGDHVVDAQPPSNNDGSSSSQSGGGGGEEEEKDSKQTIKVSGVTLVLTLVAGLAAASVAYHRKVQQQRSGGNFNNIPQEDEPGVGLTMIDPHHHNDHSKNNYTDHVELGELS